MAYTPTSPVTGSNQDDLTSPTFTLSSDVAPQQNGIQHAITAYGGTGNLVTTHSVSNPFTSTFVRPKTLKVLGVPNANGFYTNIGKNTYKLITRKGVQIHAGLDGQPRQIMIVETTVSVPAGAETADQYDVQGAISAHIGLLDDQSNEIGKIAQDGLV